MSVWTEVGRTALVGLSPIWAALVIGAICWAARYFGEATERTINTHEGHRCSSLRAKK